MRIKRPGHLPMNSKKRKRHRASCYGFLDGSALNPPVGLELGSYVAKPTIYDEVGGKNVWMLWSVALAMLGRHRLALCWSQSLFAVQASISLDTTRPPRSLGRQTVWQTQIKLPLSNKTVHTSCNIVNLEKVHITSLNFHGSLLFLSELQNQAKHLSQLLKPFILSPWPCYKQFLRRFCLFVFYLFRLNLWKIIINHRKIIK
jgi:hypothetical protein